MTKAQSRRQKRYKHELMIRDPDVLRLGKIICGVVGASIPHTQFDWDLIRKDFHEILKRLYNKWVVSEPIGLDAIYRMRPKTFYRNLEWYNTWAANHCTFRSIAESEGVSESTVKKGIYPILKVLPLPTKKDIKYRCKKHPDPNDCTMKCGAIWWWRRKLEEKEKRRFDHTHKTEMLTTRMEDKDGNKMSQDEVLSTMMKIEPEQVIQSLQSIITGETSLEPSKDTEINWYDSESGLTKTMVGHIVPPECSIKAFKFTNRDVKETYFERLQDIYRIRYDKPHVFPPCWLHGLDYKKLPNQGVERRYFCSCGECKGQRLVKRIKPVTLKTGKTVLRGSKSVAKPKVDESASFSMAYA